jgi:hypothetical protein
VGAILGLLVGWVFWPVKYVDTKVADLSPEYKEEYIVLVAYAYRQDGDLERAEVRLQRLDVPNVAQSLSATIDNMITAGRDEADIQAMASLAGALDVISPQMLAYLDTPTPLPTSTPLPTQTPTSTNVPTFTAVPSDTPTATAVPSDTPSPTSEPTDTPLPLPTRTPVPPTNTPKPTNQPKPTAPPAPSNTPEPTNPPAAKWTWSAWLVGPGQDGQLCTEGNLQIRVTVMDANGAQIQGIWVHDRYSGQNWVTGHKGNDPFWGPGEAQFDYYSGGGGSVCITTGEGGACESPYTRDLPCFYLPPIEDLHAAGYCDQCCETGATVERCRQLVDSGNCFSTGAGHFSWRVVFRRSW